MSEKKNFWSNGIVIGISVGIVLLFLSPFVEVTTKSQSYQQSAGNLFNLVSGWIANAWGGILFFFSLSIPLWSSFLCLVLWSAFLVFLLRHGIYEKPTTEDSPFGTMTPTEILAKAKQKESWLDYTETNEVPPWRFKWNYLQIIRNQKILIQPVLRNRVP